MTHPTQHSLTPFLLHRAPWRLGFRLRSALGALVVVPLCAACASNPDDGLAEAGDMVVKVLSPEAKTQHLVFDTAEVSFQRLAMVPCAGDAGQVASNAFPADLMHDPSLHVVFESYVTDYCGAHLAFFPWPDSRVEELQDATALLRGSREDGTPFEVRSTLATALDFWSPDGTPFDSMHLVLGFDLEAWSKDADVAGLEPSDDSVLIDADHNPDVLAAFDAGFESAIGLYADSNGDGELTGDELSPVATTTPP